MCLAGKCWPEIFGPRGPWGDAFVVRKPMHQPFSLFPTRRRFGGQCIGKRNVFGWEMLARRNFGPQGALGKCFCRKKTNASAFFAFSHEAPIRWSKYRQTQCVCLYLSRRQRWFAVGVVHRRTFVSTTSVPTSLIDKREARYTKRKQVHVLYSQDSQRPIDINDKHPRER